MSYYDIDEATYATETNLTFHELSSLLEESRAAIDASETHGLLIGIMCSPLSKNEDTKSYEEILYSELDCSNTNPDLITFIENLHYQTLKQLSDLNFDFTLLLPDEDETLDTRIKYLSSWCRGFLCGLALIGITDKNIEKLENDIIHEAFQDLAAIAYSDITSDDITIEEGEAMLANLIEYLRVSIQNIHMELKNPNDAIFLANPISESIN